MYLLNEDTICAPATVPGAGAISVIRVSGPDALGIVSSVVECTPGREIAVAKGYSARFGRIYSDGALLDEVVVTVFRAPHSYTGEDSAEISCHASKYIVDNIMLRLIAAGARAAAPGEFTRRAFLNGKMDLAQAEAVADLIAAENAGAHRVALNQLKGGFSSELKKMRTELLNIVTLMELELDFSEEDVEFANRDELKRLLDAVLEHVSGLISSFRMGNAIKNGIPVAIAGATNTGKSTLLNALLGEERAIVSDVHGTTRDTIEEVMNVGGLQFRFIDTAGLRETSETIERIGIERTFQKMQQAQVILGVLDATREIAQLRESLAAIMENFRSDEQKMLLIINKMDKACVTVGEIIAGLDGGADDSAGAAGAAAAEGGVAGHGIAVADSRTEGRAAGQTIAVATESGVAAPDIAVADSRTEDCEAGQTIAVATESGVAAPDIAVADGTAMLRGIPCIAISAKTGGGIAELKNTLVKLCTDYQADTDTTLVTNLRHVEALTRAKEALLRVHEGLSAGIPTDLVAQDIREAIYHLGSIVGEISTDEVLGSVFRNFCIGK